MIEFVDIVCDLSWGDTGKGKVSAYLARTGKYNYVARWAGGSNAGHTVYINGNKYKTHIIPSGVFCGIKSVIGPGCVINLNSFEEKFKDQDIPRPDYWGGFIVIPETIEFWQGHDGRLHDRLKFKKEHNGWIINRLSP